MTDVVFLLSQNHEKFFIIIEESMEISQLSSEKDQLK